VNDLLSSLTRALDLAVIERMPHEGLALAAPAPAWLATVVGHGKTLFGALPFLAHVVEEAEPAWSSGPDGRMDSGPFEATVAGQELLLRATALTVDERHLLVIERLTGSADPRSMLQTAREQALAHEALARQAAAVHAPAADVARAVAAVGALDLTSDVRRAFERLEQSAQALQAAVSALPEPRPRKRRTSGSR